MTYVYALIDPRTHSIRYVGKSTTSLSRRLINHEYKARSRRNKGPLGDWIRELQSLDLHPLAYVLEEVANEKWQTSERRWITNLLNQGERLLNVHPGGNGAHSRSPLPSHLKALLGKISDARVAEMAGLCRETITYHRKTADISAAYDRSRVYRYPKGREPHNKKILSLELISLLGTKSDKDLAESFGVSKSLVRQRRKQLGIPPARPKNRHIRGTKHHNAKLTPELANDIRAEYDRGSTTYSELGSKYQLHPSTIHSIVKGKTWKKV